MSWFTLLIKPVTEAFTGWRERKHEIRMAEQNLKITEVETEAKVIVAKAESQIKMNQNRQVHEQTWETNAVANSGWKDEYLTLYTTTLLTACFLPWTQEYVRTGFQILTTDTPVWFQVVVVIVFSSPFGVRVFTGFKSLVTGK